MKAVILAAGLGTRLQPYTFLIPKPMLPLGDKPTLEHIIDWLKESKKIDQIIICVSYLHRLIENYFEEGRRFGIKIEYSKTTEPMGTGFIYTVTQHSSNCNKEFNSSFRNIKNIPIILNKL